MARWPFETNPYVRSDKGRSTRTKTRVKLLKLIERDGPKCHWCQQTCTIYGKPSADLYATLDHLTRRADGGSNHLDNLVLACRRCNNERHGPDWQPHQPTKDQRRNLAVDIERRVRALGLRWP